MINRVINNINDKINANALGILDATIKNRGTKFIIDEIYNNVDIEIDINVFMNEIISKTNAKFIISRLHKTNIIIRKKIYKSNLF